MDLVIAPTPLHPAPRLSRELGISLLLKRDDLAGTGLGGNKLRGLEFLIADALAQGCDGLVTAGPQSNWTMLAALSCLRYGLEPHVVLWHWPAPTLARPALARPGPAGPRETCGCRRWLGVDVLSRGGGAVVGGRGHRGGHRRTARRRTTARTRCRAVARRRSVRSATCRPSEELAGAG